MNRDRRSSSNDPTSEPTATQSTPSASGVSRSPEGPGVERTREQDDEVVNPTATRDTPRRYEHPVGFDEDPVLPADDATENTKI